MSAPELHAIALDELKRRREVGAAQMRASKVTLAQLAGHVRHWCVIADLVGAPLPNYVANAYGCPSGAMPRWWHLCPRDLEIEEFRLAALKELRRAVDASVIRHNAAISDLDKAETLQRTLGLMALDRKLAAPVLGPITFPPARRVQEAA